MTLHKFAAHPRALLRRTSDDAVGMALAIVIGIGAGFGAYVFWKAIEWFSWLFFNRGAVGLDFIGDYYVILLPALGGLIVGPLVFFFAREVRGDGPPEIMEALATAEGQVRKRVAAIKVLASSVCLGSGGSAGREGPIVQIGGSLGSAVGQWLRVPRAWLGTLVLCGVAGGVSATFNAPIAGAFFALEVVQRRIIARNVGFIILSSVMADIIARIFLFTEEKPTSFAVPAYSLKSNGEIVLFMLLGLVCAFAGIGFIRFFYRTEDALSKGFSRWQVPVYLRPAIGGLLVGGIGFLSFHYISTDDFAADIFGVGYGAHYGPGGALLNSGPVDGILMGEAGALVLIGLLALKVMATSITLGSGGSGGTFAPSLLIGAALGGACGILFGEAFPNATAPPGAYAMAGMAAFFAVVVRGPITAILMLFELTGGYEFILPVMTTVVIGTIVARSLTSESLYISALRRRGVDIRRLEERDVMRRVRVSEIMTRHFPSVPLTMPVDELLHRMEVSGETGFPVVDESGRLAGIVTLSDVHTRVEKKAPGSEPLRVADIATRGSLIEAYPDQTLYEVLLQMGAKEVGHIPVVDRNDPTRLVGVLRRHDIVRAYVNEVSGRVAPDSVPRP